MQLSNKISKNQTENRHKKIKGQRTRKKAFCVLCKEYVLLTTIEQAVESVSVSRAEISRLIEIGELHCIHNSRGEVLICSASLQEAEYHFQQTRPLNLNHVGIKKSVAGKD